MRQSDRGQPSHLQWSVGGDYLSEESFNMRMEWIPLQVQRIVMYYLEQIDRCRMERSDEAGRSHSDLRYRDGERCIYNG